MSQEDAPIYDEAVIDPLILNPKVARKAILDQLAQITTNRFILQDPVLLRPGKKRGKTTVTYLSDTRKETVGQAFVKVKHANQCFAVKCVVSGKYDEGRRGRSLSQQGSDKANSLYHYENVYNESRGVYDRSYAQMKKERQNPAWKDYEVQNYLRYIRAGHKNILNLVGFAHWYKNEHETPERGISLLYYEFCDAGSLQDYAARCCEVFLPANEVFVIAHVGSQLLAAIDWLHGDESDDTQPMLVHRNIRPETVLLYRENPQNEDEWPIVKLGGLDKLTSMFSLGEELRDSTTCDVWSSPSFMTDPKDSDLWSAGAVLYSALAFGRPPPRDHDLETFNEPLLKPYATQTITILEGLLGSNTGPDDVSPRSLIRDLCDTDRFHDELDLSPWQPIEQSALNFDVLYDISNFLDLVQYSAKQYLSLCMQAACLENASRGTLCKIEFDKDNLAESLYTIFKQWWDRAELDVDLDNYIDQQDAKLAQQIARLLKSEGVKAWIKIRSLHLNLKVGNAEAAKNLQGFETFQKKSAKYADQFVRIVRPLVHDTFWYVARQHDSRLLRSFVPPKVSYQDQMRWDDKIEMDEDSEDEVQIARGPPSLRQLAAILQRRLVEEFFTTIAMSLRGEYKASRTVEERVEDEDFYIEAGTHLIESFLEDWYRGDDDRVQFDKHALNWLGKIRQQFDIDLRIFMRDAEFTEDDLLPTKVALSLYLRSENFAVAAVPFSSKYFNITINEENKKMAQQVEKLLISVQKHYLKKRILTPGTPTPCGSEGNAPKQADRVHLAYKLFEFDGKNIDILERAAKVVGDDIDTFSYILDNEFPRLYLNYNDVRPDSLTTNDNDKWEDAATLASKLQLTMQPLDPRLLKNVQSILTGAIYRQICNVIEPNLQKRKISIEEDIFRAWLPLKVLTQCCPNQLYPGKNNLHPAQSLHNYLAGCFDAGLRDLSALESSNKIYSTLERFLEGVSFTITPELRSLFHGIHYLYHGVSVNHELNISTTKDSLVSDLRDVLYNLVQNRSFGSDLVNKSKRRFLKKADVLLEPHWKRFEQNFAQLIQQARDHLQAHGVYPEQVREGKGLRSPIHLTHKSPKQHESFLVSHISPGQQQLHPAKRIQTDGINTKNGKSPADKAKKGRKDSIGKGKKKNSYSPRDNAQNAQPRPSVSQSGSSAPADKDHDDDATSFGWSDAPPVEDDNDDLSDPGFHDDDGDVEVGNDEVSNHDQAGHSNKEVNINAQTESLPIPAPTPSPPATVSGPSSCALAGTRTVEYYTGSDMNSQESKVLELEAREANAKLVWPLTTAKRRKAFDEAEIQRALAQIHGTKPLPWSAARDLIFSERLTQSRAVQLQILGSDGNTLVDTDIKKNTRRFAAGGRHLGELAQSPSALSSTSPSDGSRGNSRSSTRSSRKRSSSDRDDDDSSGGSGGAGQHTAKRNKPSVPIEIGSESPEAALHGNTAVAYSKQTLKPSTTLDLTLLSPDDDHIANAQARRALNPHGPTFGMSPKVRQEELGQITGSQGQSTELSSQGSFRASRKAVMSPKVKQENMEEVDGSQGQPIEVASQGSSRSSRSSRRTRVSPKVKQEEMDKVDGNLGQSIEVTSSSSSLSRKRRNTSADLPNGKKVKQERSPYSVSLSGLADALSTQVSSVTGAVLAPFRRSSPRTPPDQVIEDYDDYSRYTSPRLSQLKRVGSSPEFITGPGMNQAAKNSLAITQPKTPAHRIRIPPEKLIGFATPPRYRINPDSISPDGPIGGVGQGGQQRFVHFEDLDTSGIFEARSKASSRSVKVDINNVLESKPLPAAIKSLFDGNPPTRRNFLRRPTAAEMNSPDRLKELSDDEQFEHEDERYAEQDAAMALHKAQKRRMEEYRKSRSQERVRTEDLPDYESEEE